ncbi:Transglutaminase-like superfamily protein [uncultured archaeon]|nr:Transglutaminase-like superfamily protein [uncultured archaeon]
MKKLLLLLLILPIAFAQTDWFQAGFLKTELNVSSTIDIVATGPNPTIESIKADVIFVPKNSEFTAVRKFDTTPPAIITADRATYEWKMPNIGTLPYKYSAVIETANAVPRVRAKIPYPTHFSTDLRKYTLPTKNIDSNNQNVASQARLLAQNEDDLFMLTSKIGVWVKSNVNYNLNTLTAEVTQPASWVLENKYGVCDEITSLFVAMLRSLDIPARFISGIAYSNNPQSLGWGAHGWAEVYFPGTGWVPFDVTFGELGWIDPAHIKLKESLDPQEPTTIFEWKAQDVNVKVHDLTISAGLLETNGKAPSELKLTISPIRARTGFMSYNGIVLDAENLADYYVGTEFTLAKVADLKLLSNESQTIVLPPRSKSRLFWKAKVKEGLDPAFQYEMPIQAYNSKNESAKSAFSVGAWDITFSESDIDTSIAKLTASQGEMMDLACAFENDLIWTDTGKLNCLLQNRQDSQATANICMKECKEITVPARGSVPLTFDVPAVAPGPHEAEVTATSGTTVKKAVLTVVRLDPPRITIKNIAAPEAVNYGETFALRFRLARESVSYPQNVTVKVNGGGASAVVDVGELLIDQDVVVNIRSDQLYSGYPRFAIDTSYKDVFGKEFNARANAYVKVNGVPWHKRLLGWLTNLF